MNRDKIYGMFLGVAIGDALGMPAETLSATDIRTRWGRITDYQRPDGHQWFDGRMAGTWTDDTRLTLAVADAISASGRIDMGRIAAEHVEAFREGNYGWGRATAQSITRLARGIDWRNSGDPNGVGNGVAMKVGPVAAYASHIQRFPADDLIRLSRMTHRTRLAVQSAFAMTEALAYCFSADTQDFDVRSMLGLVLGASERARGLLNPDQTANLSTHLELIVDESLSPEEASRRFNGGRSYVYDSLPFSLNFFALDPSSIESLYAVVNAGGDTDSNGSMVAALLGALHGQAIFPQHLIDGLAERDRVLASAARLADAFGVA